MNEIQYNKELTIDKIIEFRIKQDEIFGIITNKLIIPNGVWAILLSHNDMNYIISQCRKNGIYIIAVAKTYGYKIYRLRKLESHEKYQNR